MLGESTKLTGGQATHSGVRFQDQVAAWCAVRMLAGEPAPSVWRLPVETLFERVGLEAFALVDDISVATNPSGRCHINAKTNVSLSRRLDSPLGKVIDQFVAEQIRAPLDLSKDRFILATSRISSSTVTGDLASVCRRAAEQPFDADVSLLATTAGERRAYERFCKLADAAWTKHASRIPTVEDRNRLLGLIIIHEFDFDGGGADLDSALAVLRRSVVDTKSKTAWTVLIDEMLRLGTERSATDRQALYSVMRRSGINLKAAPDYEIDIAELKRRTANTMLTMASFAQLEMRSASTASQHVFLDRPVVSAICDAALCGSFLVVGEPGAGKSGAIYRAAQLLSARGHPVLVLRADQPGVPILALDGPSPGLTREFCDILQHWNEGACGVLFIDALDAARGGKAAADLQFLIQRVLTTSSRWRIVASIRKFDLRYGETWRRMFAGSVGVADFQDPEFAGQRHINIPLLTDGELAEAAAQLPSVKEMLETANPQLRSLLHSPFNLQRAIDVISAGLSPQETGKIGSRDGLLAQYWKSRVGADGRVAMISREALLERILNAQILAGSLTIDIRSINLSAADTVDFEALLSNGVLVETSPDSWQPNDLIAFSHHVLFDYAAARVLLRLGRSTDDLVKMLSNAETLLRLAPASSIAFWSLWGEDSEGADRTPFWVMAFRLAGIDYRAVGSFTIMLVAQTIVERARRARDLKALIDRLGNADTSIRQSAVLMFGHITRAIVSNTLSTDRLTGADAGPWSWLSSEVAKLDLAEVRYSLRALIAKLTSKNLHISGEQLECLGSAACSALSRELDRATPDQHIVTPLIESVSMTAISDPERAAAVLERLLEVPRFNVRAHDDLFTLSRCLESLVSSVPEFLVKVFRRTFTFEPPAADEMVSLGESRILPMTTSKRSQFTLSRDLLADGFGKVTAAVPGLATATLIFVVDHKLRALGQSREIITIRIGEASYVLLADRPIISYGTEDRKSLAERWIEGLEARLASNPADQEVSDAIDVAIRSIRSDKIWNRMLQFASRHPQHIGRKFLPVILDADVLVEHRLRPGVSELVRVLHLVIGTGDREVLERALLSIPEVSVSHGLLRNLEPENCVLPETFPQLEAAQPMPAEASNADHNGLYTRSEPEEFDWLIRKGIDLQSEEAHRLVEALRQTGTLLRHHDESENRLAYWHEHWPKLNELHTALLKGSGNHAPELSGWGWLQLASLVQRVFDEIHTETKIESPSFFESARNITFGALERATASDSTSESESEALLKAAAEAVLRIIRAGGSPDEQLTVALRRLVATASEKVRESVFGDINVICRADPSLMWEVVDWALANEHSVQAMHALVRALSNCLGVDHLRATNALKAIAARDWREDDNTDSLLADVGTCVGRLYWAGNFDGAYAVLNTWIADPLPNWRIIVRLFQDLRYAIRLEVAEGSSPTDIRCRQLSIRILATVLPIAEQELTKLNALEREALEDEKLRAQHAARILDGAMTQIYFGSGAYREKSGSENDDAPPRMSPAGRRAFLAEFDLIFQTMAKVGMPNVTYHLLETLQYFVPDDPKAVFSIIAEAILVGGSRGGFQFETLGLDLAVSIVRQYLAEHRWVFSENAELRIKLTEALNLFADHGWPSAYRLVLELPHALR